MTDGYRPRGAGDHPPFRYADYRSTLKRSPHLAPLAIVQGLCERTGPGPALAARRAPTPADGDLTTNAGTGAEALGERILVTGRVLDEAGEPVAGALIEIWQANAAGRYLHPEDQHSAPLDPNFVGVGQCLTEADGRYHFRTIRPGAYPWGNHPNAWRPPHVHLSVMGPAWATRLVTQMYFPGDPLHALDPIVQSVPEPARERLIAAYDHAVSVEGWALGYRFDLILRGPAATPFEESDA